MHHEIRFDNESTFSTVTPHVNESGDPKWGPDPQVENPLLYSVKKKNSTVNHPGTWLSANRAVHKEQYTLSPYYFDTRMNYLHAAVR